MFATVTRTKGALDMPLEVATFAGEEMLPWLRQIDGFEGLLVLSSETDGTTLVISFWADREVAEKHEAARAEFRAKITSTVGVSVEDVSNYELRFANLGSWTPPVKGGEPDADA